LFFFQGIDIYLVKTKYQGITYYWANTQVRPYTGPFNLDLFSDKAWSNNFNKSEPKI
jgi:hypothetical protein